VRDISSLREDLASALLSAGFTSRHAGAGAGAGSSSSLLKSIIAAGLYPRIARITLPSSAIKFDKVQAGTVQRAQVAKEYKIFDLEPHGALPTSQASSQDPGPRPGSGRGHRVFLHPSSVLFAHDKWKEPFVCYFRKAVTTKPFLRDATEVGWDRTTVVG
jgi:ATP-dependent RNA helicase DHX57